MVYKISDLMYEKIRHFASFPQTGVSLRQMVAFGRNPSAGTMLKASQFLAEEIPIRLAHRVKELDELPHGLNDMPSIIKVKNWYAQSFDDLIKLPKPALSPKVKASLDKAQQAAESERLPETHVNPSMLEHDWNGAGVGGSANGGASKGKGKAKSLAGMYYANLNQVTDWPPEVSEYNERFTKVIEQIKKRHDPVVTTIAQGILEFKRARNTVMIDTDIQGFLDRFYMSRIGIRMLLGQHIALERLDPHPDYVGIICTNTNVHDVLREAIDNATFICEDYYGLFKAPTVQLICNKELTMTYVPSHLSHIVFEILKNSLRATIELYGADADEYPPIKVIVAEGKEDVTIKISDEGGGIPRSGVPLVWTYMYTTAEAESLDPDFSAGDFKAPLAGYGYGLPIARLYARYFGGDLKLISMEGYGTDVFLSLSAKSMSSEPLP